MGEWIRLDLPTLRVASLGHSSSCNARVCAARSWPWSTGVRHVAPSAPKAVATDSIGSQCQGLPVAPDRNKAGLARQRMVCGKFRRFELCAGRHGQRPCCTVSTVELPFSAGRASRRSACWRAQCRALSARAPGSTNGTRPTLCASSGCRSRGSSRCDRASLCVMNLE